MKLLFYTEDSLNIREKPLGYRSLNNDTGFSGTETALIEISHYLKNNGHKIQIFGTSKTYNDDDISYISSTDIHLIDYEVDWYCPIFFLWLEHHDYILKQLPTKTKVLIWMQSFIEDSYLYELIKIRPNNVFVQAVAEYVKNEYLHIIPEKKCWVIHNGINSSLTTSSININSKRGNWIFHAVYGRGCEIAINIFSKISKINKDIASHMNILSYYKPDFKKILKEDNVEFNGSRSKKEVYNILEKTDYFVYPLVDSNTSVHHDCCSTAVMEALAQGVIVVTWDSGCTSSVYGDYVIKVNVPENKRDGYNPTARFSKCKWLLTDEANDMLINEILELEKDQVRKEQIRERGIKWAREYNWEKLACDMEYNLMIR